MTVTAALIGAEALYLLFAWLASAIVASWLSDRKGYGEKPGLAVEVALAEPGTAVRVVIRGEQSRYYVVRNGELFAADISEERVDRGVYQLLAALGQLKVVLDSACGFVINR